MSTYVKVVTNSEIDRGIRSLKLGSRRKVQSIQAQTFAAVLAHVLAIYKGVSPLLRYMASWMILPTSWRAGLTAFLDGLDLLATMPIVVTPPPVVAAAASDTTIPDPTSSDPSFKAGKDL